MTEQLPDKSALFETDYGQIESAKSEVVIKFFKKLTNFFIEPLPAEGGSELSEED